MSHLTPPQASELGENNVQVWIFSSATLIECGETLLDHLDEREREEALSYISTRERERFSLYRAAFRRVLGWYVPCDPRDVRLIRNRNGKPSHPHVVADGEVKVREQIHFNLSHSHDWAVVAVSRGGELGVDIERVRLPNGVQTLMDHFFLASEAEAVLQAPEALRAEAFCRLWTRKEAAVKSFGGSLAEWIRDLDVGGQEVNISLRHPELPPLELQEFPVAPGYIGCLCTSFRPAAVTLHQFDCGYHSGLAG